MAQTTYRPVISPTNVNSTSPFNFSQRSPFYQSYNTQIAAQQNSSQQFVNAMRQPSYNPASTNIFLQNDEGVANNNGNGVNMLNIPRYAQQNMLSSGLNMPAVSPFRSSASASQMALQRSVVPEVARDSALVSRKTIFILFMARKMIHLKGR